MIRTCLPWEVSRRSFITLTPLVFIRDINKNVVWKWKVQVAGTGSDFNFLLVWRFSGEKQECWCVSVHPFIRWDNHRQDEWDGHCSVQWSISCISLILTLQHGGRMKLVHYQQLIWFINSSPFLLSNGHSYSTLNILVLHLYMCHIRYKLWIMHISIHHHLLSFFGEICHYKCSRLRWHRQIHWQRGRLNYWSLKIAIKILTSTFNHFSGFFFFFYLLLCIDSDWSKVP